MSGQAGSGGDTEPVRVIGFGKQGRLESSEQHDCVTPPRFAAAEQAPVHVPAVTVPVPFDSMHV